MTPAVAALNKCKIPYQILSYQHDNNSESYGLEAAEKLAVAPASVFKTLVISDNNQQLSVAIVPVTHQLSLKAAAKALKVKKVQLADEQKVIASTGYVLGGVSPFGQKKCLMTLIDDSCHDFEKIYVSAGKRGLELAVVPSDLVNHLRATCCSLKL